MKRNIITPAELPAAIAVIDNGAFFGVTFRKQDGSLRTARAQMGVRNPRHTAKPNGTGESATEALAAGRLKFFDSTVTNADGSKGGYRQARMIAIVCLCIAGKLYIVDHTAPRVRETTKTRLA